ncbi:peptidylglycine alpha-amidating monooxygenase, partial [Clostridioides difficile]|uniref:monooxygenase n=1 Tax=Clostridioides difficile TaxID=1496 RepID=UPI0018DE73B6
VDVPKYDFNAQQWLPNTSTLAYGDTIRTRCVWNNTTNAAVGFGENTEQEMCFSFMMYYPKRDLATWLQPTIGATCGVTK